MGVERFEFFYLRIVDGVGEIVAIDAFYIRFAAFIIEFLNVILAGFV